MCLCESTGLPEENTALPNTDTIMMELLFIFFCGNSLQFLIVLSLVSQSQAEALNYSEERKANYIEYFVTGCIIIQHLRRKEGYKSYIFKLFKMKLNAKK